MARDCTELSNSNMHSSSPPHHVKSTHPQILPFLPLKHVLSPIIHPVLLPLCEPKPPRSHACTYCRSLLTQIIHESINVSPRLLNPKPFATPYKVYMAWLPSTSRASSLITLAFILLYSSHPGPSTPGTRRRSFASMFPLPGMPVPLLCAWLRASQKGLCLCYFPHPDPLHFIHPHTLAVSFRYSSHFGIIQSFDYLVHGSLTYQISIFPLGRNYDCCMFSAHPGTQEAFLDWMNKWMNEGAERASAIRGLAVTLVLFQ